MLTLILVLIMLMGILYFAAMIVALLTWPAKWAWRLGVMLWQAAVIGWAKGRTKNL